MSSTSRTRQRGQVAVLFALAALAIVAIAGLALDAGQAFVSQRALQAGSDTAAQTGATMLAVDYNHCLSGAITSTGDGPYSQSLIYSQVTTLAKYAAAAQGHATSTPTVHFVSYAPNVPPNDVRPWISPSFCTINSAGSAGWTGPSGVEVTTSDTHPTTVLGIVGIKSATEAASSIALIGNATGAGGAPFGVWFETCISSTLGSGLPPPVNSTVTLFSPKWDQTTCGAYSPSSDRASFKGYFDLPAPMPLSSSGCIQTGAGVGSKVGLANPPAPGTAVYVPFITHVWSFDTTPPVASGCPTINAKGTFDLEYVGFVSVTILPTTSASMVQGTVRSYASVVPGLTICPVGETTCAPSNPSPVVAYIWH